MSLRQRSSTLARIAACVFIVGCVSRPHPSIATEVAIRSTWSAAEEFKARSGRWPEWSDICRSGRGDETCQFLPMGAGFNDGWGRPMRYFLVQAEPRVASAGPDGLWETSDDITLDSGQYKQRVDGTAGCYALSLPSWRDFPGQTLRLDTVKSLNGFRAAPEVKPFSGPVWRPVYRPFAADSIEVLWLSTHHVVVLTLRAETDSLTGNAQGIDHAKVVARRTSCAS